MQDRFNEIADRISKENDWNDFSDVVFNAERRTIQSIIDKTLEEIDNPNVESEYRLSEGAINGTILNEKMRDEDLHEYHIIDRTDFIDELIGWIGEATTDKELMKQDLEMLMNVEDEYILSSNSTNDYIYVGCGNFDDTCKELLELNSSLD